MKKIFYRKEGRRYVPVSEYDHDLLMAMPKGAHLIVSVPGGHSTHYNIDPNYAAMIAAGKVANDAIVKVISDASALRIPERSKKPLTEGQILAWKKLQQEMGAENYPLEWPSYQEAAEAGIKAMEVEAEKLMQHPSVKEAWDHFQTVAKLCYAETR